jgi:cysteine desulfurase
MDRPLSIDLDSNATTRIDPRALEAMLPLLREQGGNASSRHHLGAPATKALAAARRTVADALGARPGEILFTSGGTEADNLAVRGVVLAAPPPRHVVTTAVEHPAVLDTCRALAAAGACELTTVGVDADGALDLAALQRALRPGRTCLVSAMWANNETGVVFPVDEIGRLAKAAGARFHVDAVQAVARQPVDLAAGPIDLLTVSAHKLHGPLGAGALFVRRGVSIAPQLTGGGQEHGRRSGTENVPAIAGFAVALRLALEAMPAAVPRMTALRDRLQAGLAAAIPGLRVTGAGSERVCNTLHVTLSDVESDALLLALDREGLAASAGSACSSGALGPSHVLEAMGLPGERMHNAIRFSLSRETTGLQIDRAIQLVPRIAARLSALADPGRR